MPYMRVCIAQHGLIRRISIQHAHTNFCRNVILRARPLGVSGRNASPTFPCRFIISMQPFSKFPSDCFPFGNVGHFCNISASTENSSYRLCAPHSSWTKLKPTRPHRTKLGRALCARWRAKSMNANIVSIRCSLCGNGGPNNKMNEKNGMEFLLKEITGVFFVCMPLYEHRRPPHRFDGEKSMRQNTQATQWFSIPRNQCCFYGGATKKAERKWKKWIATWTDAARKARKNGRGNDALVGWRYACYSQPYLHIAQRNAAIEQHQRAITSQCIDDQLTQHIHSAQRIIRAFFFNIKFREIYCNKAWNWKIS